jgi:hypothetical protein
MANLNKVYSDLSFKPFLNNEGDLSQVYDQDAINQSLFNILHTKKGTRLMDPDFGCDFQTYLFDIFDEETANNMLEDIYRNFITYEPRIQILSIDRNLDYDKLLYQFTINYFIINKNEKGKFDVVLQKL